MTEFQFITSSIEGTTDNCKYQLNDDGKGKLRLFRDSFGNDYTIDVIGLKARNFSRLAQNLHKCKGKAHIATIEGVDSENRLVLVENLDFKARSFTYRQVYKYQTSKPNILKFSSEYKLLLRGVTTAISEMILIGVSGGISHTTIGFDGGVYKLVDVSGAAGYALTTLCNDVYAMIMSIPLPPHHRVSADVTSFLRHLKVNPDISKISNHPAIKRDGDWLEYINGVYQAHFDQTQPAVQLSKLAVFPLPMQSELTNWVIAGERYLHFYSILYYSGKIGYKSGRLLDMVSFIRNFDQHINEHIKRGFNRLQQPTNMQKSPLPIAPTNYTKVQKEECLQSLFENLASYLYERLPTIRI